MTTRKLWIGEHPQALNQPGVLIRVTSAELAVPRATGYGDPEEAVS